MKCKPWFSVLVLCFCCLFLSGCNTFNEIAKEVLPQICDSFPDSVLYRIDPRVLWIQTQVDGVSAETALKIFQTACQEAPKHIGKLTINITAEMNFANRRFLVMGFKRFIVTWNVRDGVDAGGIPNAKVYTTEQTNEWFAQSLGYVPDPNHVFVVDLADLKNANGNQPIEGTPLPHAQLETRERQAAELQQQIQQNQQQGEPSQ